MDDALGMHGGVGKRGLRSPS